MEHIPSHILDWIEEKDFDALTDSQQSDVIQYLSKEEYDELHYAFSAVKLLDAEQLEPSLEVKKNLLSSFDNKYNNKQTHKKSILLYPVQLWKVAAVFLFLTGGVLWFFIQAKSHKEISYVTIKDTVYVPSFAGNEEAIKVYDTVYIHPEMAEKKTAKKDIRHRVHVAVKEQSEAIVSSSSIPGVGLLSIKDKDALPNKQKGNSLKDDTLLQQFKFVRL